MSPRSIPEILRDSPDALAEQFWRHIILSFGLSNSQATLLLIDKEFPHAFYNSD
ncbi:MAG: hypothetical protein LBJ67_14540 [Planctomycetaceae bacterium]|nr:hypothetical protein [Planctomycetaceae bacterium]